MEAQLAVNAPSIATSPSRQGVRELADEAIDAPRSVDRSRNTKAVPLGRTFRPVGFNMQSVVPARSDFRFLLVRTAQVIITTLLTAVVGAIACSSTSRASDGSTVAADRDVTSIDASERNSAQP
jgi:hypothetical protein